MFSVKVYDSTSPLSSEDQEFINRIFQGVRNVDILLCDEHVNLFLGINGAYNHAQSIRPVSFDDGYDILMKNQLNRITFKLITKFILNLGIIITKFILNLGIRGFFSKFAKNNLYP